MKYSMKCTCGHVLSVDASDHDTAVKMLKEQMTQAALDEHWNKFHMNDTMPKPTLEQSHMMIEQTVVEGMLEEGKDQGQMSGQGQGQSMPPMGGQM